MDEYFTLFEGVANTLKWPEEFRPLLLPLELQMSDNSELELQMSDHSESELQMSNHSESERENVITHLFHSESEQEMSDNSELELTHELPETLTYLKTLGSGSYGKVLKCWDSVTNSIVAVKIPIDEQDTTELDILRKLQSSECHRYNIIKFIGFFDHGPGKGLVFEKLDVDLHEYIFSLN